MSRKQMFWWAVAIGLSSFTWLLFTDWRIALAVLGMQTANNLVHRMSEQSAKNVQKIQEEILSKEAKDVA